MQNFIPIDRQTNIHTNIHMILKDIQYIQIIQRATGKLFSYALSQKKRKIG